MDPPEIRNRVLLVGEPELQLPLLIHRLRNSNDAPQGGELPPTFAVFPDRLAGSPVTLLTLTIAAMEGRRRAADLHLSCAPPESDIVVLVYDATNRASLDALVTWHTCMCRRVQCKPGTTIQFATLRIEPAIKGLKPEWVNEESALRLFSSLSIRAQESHITVKDSYTRDDLDKLVLCLTRLSIKLYETRKGVRFCGPRPCPSNCNVGRAPHHHIVREHTLFGREDTVMLVDEHDRGGARMADGIERGWIRVMLNGETMADIEALSRPVRRVITPPSGSGARLVARNALTHRGPMREDTKLLTTMRSKEAADEWAPIAWVKSWFGGGGGGGSSGGAETLHQENQKQRQ